MRWSAVGGGTRITQSGFGAVVLEAHVDVHLRAELKKNNVASIVKSASFGKQPESIPSFLRTVPTPLRLTTWWSSF